MAIGIGSLVERAYRTRLGRIMSLAARPLAWLHAPRMLYGVTDPASREFRKYTRISSSAVILGRARLAVQDHVWIGHGSILDASEGLSIEEGVQLAFRVGVFTHGSEDAIRLLGREYVNVPKEKRPGYKRGAVRIGAFSYLGSGAVVLPGRSIGRGCILGAGSVLASDLPDFAIAVGAPARIVGSTLERDAELVAERGTLSSYFDPDALRAAMARRKEDPCR